MTVERVLRLKEAEAQEAHDLTLEQVRWLMDAGVAEASPSRSSGWTLRTRNVAGVVSHRGLTVEVEPKLPVARILWLLEHAAVPGAWDRSSVLLGEDSSLTDAVTRLFLRSVEDLLGRHGLQRGYEEVEETSWTVRGRIREAEQLTRHLGRTLPAEVRFDDFALNTPANRLILSAVDMVRGHAWRRLGTTAGAAAQARRAELLAGSFEGVRPFVPGESLPAGSPPRSHRGYAWPVELARLILSGGSLDLSAGTRQARGLLLELPRIFEAFLGTELGRHLGGRLSTQATLPYALEGHHAAHRLRPDLLVRADDGSPAVVLDAKYKHSESPTMHDLRQMHVYARVFGVPDVVLVYGKATPPRTLELEPGIRLHVRGIDLNGTSARILSQVQGLARL